MSIVEWLESADEDGEAAVSINSLHLADTDIGFDPADEWQVRTEALASLGKHTPFSGHAMRGRARFTLVGGRVVHG